MFHKFLLYLTCSSLLFGMTALSVSAQPCADTQPTIAGAQIVCNNQIGVMYSTPNIPGHTYSWTVTGGNIVAGGNTSQISVTWGLVGTGSINVTETNPSIPCNSTASLSVKIQPLLISYFYYIDSSCYGNELQFYDHSVADPTKPIVDYSINFGDGSPTQHFAVAPFPVSHTYLGPIWNITYAVTYIVTNNEGAKDTIYDAVYVNPNQFIPTAAFIETIPNCSYQAVSFDGTVSTTPPLTTPIERYAWNFGDPASGASNYDSCDNCGKPTHIFSGPGTYNVTLKILNEKSCRDDVTQQVVIAQSVPTSKYSFSSPTCQNNPVFFTDNSTFPAGKDITIWEWYFGDGTAPVIVNAPASPNVTHVFPALGPYTVELRVINNLGCTDSAYHSVALTPSPVADYSYNTPCAGDTMHFQNHSKQNNGPAIVYYYWNFGDPSGNNTSNQKDGTHVYADSGTYIVTLAIANTTGCPDTLRKSVHINAKPAVEYTWNVGNLNNEIQFHIDSLPGGITNLGMIGSMCQWDFGDGTYGYGHNPVHTYLGSNNWTVILTVTDTLGCSNSVGHVVYVPEIPMAFYSSNSPVCLNKPMCFNDLSSVPSPPFGYIATWVWDFGDGTAKDTIHFPNDPNVCHVYLNPGTYSVTLYVTDNSGFTDSYSHDQIVLPLPIANFYFSTPCQGKLVQFTDGSFPNGGGNIISWGWNFGDPLTGSDNYSLQPNPTHIFSDSGCFAVRLIVQNFDGCIDTVIKQVCVFPFPPVDFTRDTACLGDLLHFYANTTITHIDSIVTWLWDFGDGTTNTDPVNTSHNYGNAGIFIATLTVVDHHGCTNTVSHMVRVNPKPIPEFSWSSPACTGGVIQFTDQSTVPAGYTGYVAKWLWDFGDGSSTQLIIIPGSPNVTHVFPPGSTSYLVRLTVWTSDSCSLYKEHLVTLIPSPIAGFDYAPVTCQGQAIQFNDLSQENGGGGITQWHWNFGDPTSGNNIATIKNPAHTFASAGPYTVTLTVQNATGCSSTISQTVTVNQLPLADFHADTVCFNNVTTFTSLSVPNAGPTGSIISYLWDFGDGTPPSLMQNPPHTYLTYGIFYVKLTVVNSNGCTKDTTKQVLVHPLPIPEFTFSSPNCFGAVVHFTDLSHTVSGYLGSIVKWVWDFGDTNVVTIIAPAIPDINHTFAGTALSHTVRLTITTTDGCTSFIEHIVNSIPAPTANFSYSPITCTSQLVYFTDYSQENGGSSIMAWSWTFGDPLTGPNNSSTAKNPVHSFSSFGNFIVTLIVTNTDGCHDTIADTVHVNMLPVANFTATTACLGSITTFSSGPSIPNAIGIISYLWDFGDASGTSPLANPTYIYTSYGIFNVKLTIVNSNGCIKDTTKQVLVNPLPIPAFTYTSPNCLGAVVNYINQSTTVTGYLGSIVTWVWHFGDGSPDLIINAPSNPNVTHTFVGNATGHTVRLTVTTSDGCVAFIEHLVTSMPSPIASFSFPTSDCANQSVTFTDNSQENGGGTITQWHWNFGDPASGILNNTTSQSPAHIFVGGPKVYTVIEIVTNATGCSSADTQSITIIARPIANFHADTVCLGSLTTFTDQSTATGTITQRLWQFGDGTNSNLTNPTHPYLSAGVFHVTLTVTTNEGCTRDTIKDVLVIAQPVASFITTAPACAGDSVHFTSLSSTPHGIISTWAWTFGDGNTGTGPVVSHLYTSGGTYAVTLTITTSDNCTATKTSQVVIQPAPNADFMYATTRCAQMPFQFTDQSQAGGLSPITQWLWNFGDPASGSNNTSTLKNPTHPFSHSGNFSVNLMVTTGVGCFDSTSKMVSVNASPIAKFVADTACVGSPTIFADSSIANSASMTSWLWNFGEPASGTDNTSTLQNPSHTYGSPGLFTVMLTVTNSNGCTHDTTKQITVNPRPQAMFSAAVACVGDSTSFTDLSIAPGSALTDWYWDFGDGSNSTIENPKHKYTSAGTFNVMLRVTNLSGCLDSITIPVTTHPKPVAAFSYTNFFCPAGQVVFQDQSQGTGAAIVQREWIFEPNQTSSMINPTFVYTITDTTYFVSLIVTDSYGCMDTISDSVYVKPGFAFTFRNDTVCFKNPTHFTAIDLAKGDSLYNVSWNFGDPNSAPNNISYLFDPQHTFSQPGIYSVKLKVTDSDNCTDSLYRDVTVHALPAPAFSVISMPCDSVIHFRDSTTAGSGTILSWEWNFGDGSPILTIPGSVGSGDTSHIYLVENIYPVVLKVTNTFGCYDTLMKTAEMYPCIFASFTHNDTLMCARYKIAFSDSSLPVNIINQWHWIFGDGKDTTYSQHSGVIYHIFTDTGVYNVSLIIHATVPASGRIFVDTTTQSLVIHPTPMPYFSNLSVCKKQFTVFKDTSNTFGTAVNSWKWIFGESYSGSNDTSHLKNPTHKYDSAGLYSVKMVVMNHFGCKDSILKPTRVFEIPTAIFDHSLACSGKPTDFTDKSLIPDTAKIINWFWNFGEVISKKDTSLLKDPVHQYGTDGDFIVRLIVKDQHGCYDTVDSTIIVHVTPVSSFTYTDNVNNMTGKLQFNNKSVGADTYFWDFGNGQTSTDENPIVTYANDGSFLIMLISDNQFNCSDTTFYKYEFIFKGLYIPNAFAPSSLSSGANLFAPVGVNLKQFKIEVFDNWGHLLWSSVALNPLGKPSESWDGKDANGVLLPSGTYMWKASATFIDNTDWQGSDIGKGDYKTSGTVTLIR